MKFDIDKSQLLELGVFVKERQTTMTREKVIKELLARNIVGEDVIIKVREMDVNQFQAERNIFKFETPQ